MSVTVLIILSCVLLMRKDYIKSTNTITSLLSAFQVIYLVSFRLAVYIYCGVISKIHLKF